MGDTFPKSITGLHCVVLVNVVPASLMNKYTIEMRSLHKLNYKKSYNILFSLSFIKSDINFTVLGQLTLPKLFLLNARIMIMISFTNRL